MTEQNQSNAKFLTPLVTEALQDDLNVLTSPLIFKSSWFGRYFTAKTGFTTDFCSVPRLPLLYAMFGGRFRKTGTIHDNVYRYLKLPKWAADLLIIELSRAEGATWCEAISLYIGVAILGPVWYWVRGEKSPYGGKDVD